MTVMLDYLLKRLECDKKRSEMQNCELAEFEEIIFKTFTIFNYQIEGFYRYLCRLSFHLELYFGSFI